MAKQRVRVSVCLRGNIPMETWVTWREMSERKTLCGLEGCKCSKRRGMEKFRVQWYGCFNPNWSLNFILSVMARHGRLWQKNDVIWFLLKDLFGYFSRERGSPSWLRAFFSSPGKQQTVVKLIKCQSNRNLSIWVWYFCINSTL